MTVRQVDAGEGSIRKTSTLLEPGYLGRNVAEGLLLGKIAWKGTLRGAAAYLFSLPDRLVQ
jgi:hypothetical protein